jgi:hypothetical protein
MPYSSRLNCLDYRLFSVVPIGVRNAMCFSGLWFYLRNISQTNNDKSGLLPVGCLSCAIVNFSKRLFRLFSKRLFRLFSKRLFSS